MNEGPGPYELKAVAHLIGPWGAPVRDLEALRAGVAEAPVDVLFHHALQYQLRHAGAEEMPPDDFGAWIGGVVQDVETAERVSFAVLNAGGSVEATRTALLSVLDSLPEKRRTAHDAPEGSEFRFLAATSVDFSTGVTVTDVEALLDALVHADPSVWFLHLVEEPWRSGGRATLLAWLDARPGAEASRLARWLEEAATSGLPVDAARAHVARRWHKSGIARRLADSAEAGDEARREARKEAIASLVRRTRRWGGAR